MQSKSILELGDTEGGKKRRIGKGMWSKSVEPKWWKGFELPWVSA